MAEQKLAFSPQNPIRVGIRGMAGLLGLRLAEHIAKTPDMKLTVGVVKKDRTLDNLLSVARQSHLAGKLLLPDKTYLDEKQKVVKEANDQNPQLSFEPADQLDISKECDIFVDATSPGVLEAWRTRYKKFKGSVIIQSGEFPEGKLISLPLIQSRTEEDDNLYRQGDCILCGAMPVLNNIKNAARQVTVTVLTQYTDKLNDYTTDDRLNAVYVREDMKTQIAYGINLLLGDDSTLMPVLQVPGLSHYLISVVLDLKMPATGRDLRQKFEDKPRLVVLSDITSTFDIRRKVEALEIAGRALPPIIVFGAQLESLKPVNRIEFFIALNYRPLVALANIDSIRALATGIDPMESMKLTDKYVGY